MKYFNLKRQKEIFYVLILFFFSIFINQYYGYIGINPIDSFFSFNSGYDIFNGYYPFKDYWTITGPFIAFVQSIFFKIFGVNWFSYVFHASIFNSILVLSVFFILYELKLNIHYCFLYSLLISILAYPSVGTPYVDHHASYLSIISILFFILAVKTNKKIYWFGLPIILAISFLSKQTPTGYFFLLILSLSIIYFVFNFNINKIVSIFLGTLTILSIFLIFLSISQISLQSFLDQYIIFPLSIGESRLDFLFPLEFKRIILRYKLFHISYFPLLYIVIKKIIEDYKYLKSDEFLIIIALILSSYILIIHQLMTVNGLYIFFIIPILTAFSHIYSIKYLKNKKYITYFLILLSVCSTIHYLNKYIHTRDFADLKNIDKRIAINAEVLDDKLSKIKWITPLYPTEPKKEILRLTNVINIIKNDERKKSIITDYQFISVILSIYDFSPGQVWFINHPLTHEVNSKYFTMYKKFLIDKLKKNEIEVVYIIKPLWAGNDIIEKGLDKDCIDKMEITEILDIYLLKKCKELKN